MATHEEIRRAVYDYYENLSHLYTVDEVWQENGETLAMVSPRHSQSEPADSTIYRAALVEKCLRGEDVLALEQEEVEFINGMLSGGDCA